VVGNPKALSCLRPFWRYYGGKWRAAPRYPKPRFSTIIEPFAGAAGYSLRYYDHNVILVEKYPVIAEMWRYLIGVSPEEIKRIPAVEHVDELPSWVPQGGRYLVGFCMNAATTRPCKSLSSGRKQLREMGRKFEGWGDGMKARVSSQVPLIRHWKIIEGNYTDAPELEEATWFVDPPYNNQAGSYYVHHSLDFPALGDWCRSRPGQVIACENEGADWLPFKPFAVLKAGVNGKGSHEVIWEKP